MQGDGLRRQEEGECGGKCFWRKARLSQRQSATAESRAACGAFTVSLSAYALQHFKLDAHA